MNKSFTARVLVLLAGLLLMAAAVSAQSAPTANNPAGNLDQCRNGADAAHAVDCADLGGSLGWTNANAGDQNSHWAENDFLPYRDVMTNLPLTSGLTITIGYDILKNGKHAVDYLGSYNGSYANTFPCSGVTSAACTGANPAPTSQFLIPQDGETVTNNTNPNTGLPIVQIPGYFSMWGGTITNVQYVPYAGGEHRQITVTFTASSSTVVLAWGGHVAWIGDWGAGNSASQVSGSPYHGSQDTCSFGCGAQDRSLAVDAVEPTGAVLINKEVLTDDCTDSSSAIFNFGASTNLGATGNAFTLVDNVPGTSPCPASGHTFTPGPAFSKAITNFGVGNQITVSELQSAGGAVGAPLGYTLNNINCVESGLQNSTKNDASTATATIVVEAFETVTCTFTNASLLVTAAPASVSGRVTNSSGNGISGVTVTLNDLSSGKVRTTLTNSFGYYTFTNCTTEDFYVLSVASKRYKFSPSQTTFSLTGNFTDANFTAQ